MCGIAGVIPADKNRTGSMLVKMLKELEHRGPDSAGIGIYRREKSDGMLFHVVTADSPGADRLKKLLKHDCQVKDIQCVELKKGTSFKFTVPENGFPDSVLAKLCSDDGFEIHSVGKRFEIMKDVGAVSFLDDNFKISKMSGTHGIGHVRLATESKVDRNYSHPFQSLNLPDIAIVHNGQITNYHNLRRKLERRGYLFKTENDSELIAQLSAHYLKEGKDLYEALKVASQELDGTFSFIVATADGMGIAKDNLGAKPMMVGENKKGLAIASEEIAIREVLGDGVKVVELPPGEVRTWRIS